METEIKWADGQAVIAESDIRWADGQPFVYYAVATITLLTEGVYMMIDLGGGLVYLKPTSPRLKVNLTTGHVGEIT